MSELILLDKPKLLVPLREATEPGINISTTAFPFGTQTLHYVMKEGQSIAEILEHLSHFPAESLSAHVFVNDTYIPKSYWPRVYPKAGSDLSIKILPGKSKGKNPLAIVLSIAVIAVAAWAAPMIAGALGGGVLGTIGGALASAAINAIGGLLINAIAPPSKPRTNSPVQNAVEAQTMFIEGARNTIDYFGVVPVILGRHRTVPKLGAYTYTESAGADQFVTQLYVWGMGKYEAEGLKIGETPITDYTDYTFEHFLDGEGSDATPTVYTNSIYQEELSVELTQAAGWIQRTTTTGCDKFIVDVTMPQGCCAYDSQTGARGSYTVTFEVSYSPAGANTWTSPVQYIISTSTNVALRRQYEFQPPHVDGIDQFDVRMRRTSTDTTDDKIFDDTFWTALKTVTFENPINMKGLSFSGGKIKATDQLNGAVDQLNDVLFGIIPSYNYLTGLWTEQTSNNPADLFRFILQNSELFRGEDGSPYVDVPNARPIEDNRIDFDTIEDWHDYNRIRGFQYNAVIDFEGSVWDALSEVAAAGRAKPTLVDGKWSVVVDKVKTVIAQHVTPANSWGYSNKRIFPEIPHALRIMFVNEEAGFLQDEMMVYDDGYSEKGLTPGTVAATKIAGMQFIGITKPSLIWIHGREHIASMRLRPNEHSFYMDVEHLVMSRGSLIKFAHDVPLIGTAQGYIKDIIARPIARQTDDGTIRETDEGFERYLDDGTETAGVVLDRTITMDPTRQYSLRIRVATTGETLYRKVETINGDTNELYFIPAFEEGVVISPDDLFMFGETDRETIDLIVRDIVPGEDLTAKIVALDAAPAIFSAGTGPIPDYDSRITVPPEMERPKAPVIINIQTGVAAQVQNPDGSVSANMVITLQNNNVFDVVPYVKIKLSEDTDFVEADMIQSTANRVVISGLSVGRRYDIQVYYKRAAMGPIAGLNGTMYSPITQRNLIKFEGTTDRPLDITNFKVQLINGMALLTWDSITAFDFDHYEIRYTPSIVDASWYSATPIKRDLKNNETLTPAGTGTYLIKAFDRSGAESANEAMASLVVVDERYNAVEAVDEHPDFLGTHENTLVNGDRLELDDLSAGGIYYGIGSGSGYVDLGNVFTARILGHVLAYGRSSGNTMDKWPTLDKLGFLSGDVPSGWSVVFQISTTSDDPTDIGASWTTYSTIIAGDYTFRAVRYRVLLQGNGVNITPTIEELRLLIDMEDRVERALNVTVPDTGLTVVYAEPFNATPTLVPALLDGQEGDVVSITSETAAGFTYAVTNGGIGVERHINYHVIGYGRVTT